MVTFFSAMLCIDAAYGKYTMKVNVGSLEISVVQTERRSHLSDSSDLNIYFRYNLITDVVFGSYDSYPQMRGARGLDIGEYDESVTEDERIRIHFRGFTAYILSEKVIYASSMDGMFKNCRFLNSVKFSNFDVSDVKSMKEMFYNCPSLTEVVFNFDTEKTEDMSGMFSQCTNLQSLDLSGFDTSSVSNMNEMFSGCRRLGTIYVSERWSTQNVLTGTDMFKDCNRLRGGNGTRYNARQVSYVMAKIDREGTQGYLTAK